MSRDKILAEKNELLDVISFSRLYKGNLTTAEIIQLHQYMQRGIALPNKIKVKIIHIKTEIQLLNFNRPITRLNSEGQTEQLNTDTGKWTILKSKK